MSLTLTVFANITANYAESLGNKSCIQKIFRNGMTYPIRTKESLKEAVCTQSGLYNDVRVMVNGAAQKMVSEEVNTANCRALEGGYMTTVKGGKTFIRNSSFYFTDAVGCDPFYANTTRFGNNLHLAKVCADANGVNLNENNNAKDCGLMPHQSEFDLSMKKYSFTIDLSKVGRDENFITDAPTKEKVERVTLLLSAIRDLTLTVKGNLDCAEPLFVAGGIGKYKGHYFDNVSNAESRKLYITDDLITRMNKDGYDCALLMGRNFVNEDEIIEHLKPKKVDAFFDELIERVEAYYRSEG